MNHKYTLLSIDESGKASYNHPSKLFILSAVLIPEKLKPRIGTQLSKLKKRYFGKDNVVFHGRDMMRRKGIFAILKNSTIETNFYSDYLSIINNPMIGLSYVIVDKRATKAHGWQTQTVLLRSYLKILSYFCIYLKKIGHQGKVIVESDPSQDLFLIRAHNILQSAGIQKPRTPGYIYRSLITSLSLVNKNNMDADIQIADSLAHIAGLITKYINKKSEINLDKISLKKLKLIKRKLSNSSNGSLYQCLP
jgi:hypothetical protein